MTELNPDAAALIRAGRTAFRPDTSDRDRVLDSLNAVLGEGVAPDGGRPSGQASAAAASRFAFKSWVIGGLAAVALGTGGIAARHMRGGAPAHAGATRPAPVTAPVEPAATATPAPPDVASDPEPLRAEPARSSPRSGPRAAARTAADSLPQEVRLLSRAEQQLGDGLAAEALRTLAEHERRFPTGALAEERMAARVQALCALGRTAEARSDLARLTRAHPQSPHVERARKVCGIEVDSSP
ncbi:MAG TPA: hypothetical protein VE987_03145 [Polyangiaceae bacterium]|nr:hypothetical protein [Polyangiaceae bacterium]